MCVTGQDGGPGSGVDAAGVVVARRRAACQVLHKGASTSGNSHVYWHGSTLNVTNPGAKYTKKPPEPSLDLSEGQD